MLASTSRWSHVAWQHGGPITLASDTSSQRPSEPARKTKASQPESGWSKEPEEDEGIRAIGEPPMPTRESEKGRQAPDLRYPGIRSRTCPNTVSLDSG